MQNLYASEPSKKCRLLWGLRTLTRARQRLLQSLPAVSNPTSYIGNETLEELPQDQTSSLRCSPPPDIHLISPPVAHGTQGSDATTRKSGSCYPTDSQEVGHPPRPRARPNMVAA